MDAQPANALYAYAGAFVDELARAGLRHVCVCPGSRSTPLALCIAQHPDLRVWMHLDERSAAFFALGLAKAGREPVALLCTSGTAAANFMPAVVEANLSRVALVVLTADRPPELREVGAAQTIDQIRLFGSHAKWSVEMPTPGASDELLRYARATAGRAVATALAAPRGPIHLNFPFREPLVPTAAPHEQSSNVSEVALHGRADGQPFVAVPEALPAAASPSTLMEIARHVWAVEEGLIVCGPCEDPDLADALAALAVRAGYPILADPLSGLRAGRPAPSAAADATIALTGNRDHAPVIDAYDAMLRGTEAVEALAPRMMLRFGDVPTSKPLLQYLQRHASCRQIVVARGAWPDPALLAVQMIDADPATFCRGLARLLSREHPSENVAACANPAQSGNPGINSGESHVSPSAELVSHTLHGLQTKPGVPTEWLSARTVKPPEPEFDALSARPSSQLDMPVGSSQWQQRWFEANRRTRAALTREMDSMDELFEGRVFAELAELLPAGATLWAGSSMPVRDLDTFFPACRQPVRFLANRGANGIDGVVSSALGAAASGSGPTVLAIGDISLYHDMNGLLAAARHHLSLTIVLLNNDGGGIFSFLPQATALGNGDGDTLSTFELLFGTPHGLDFRHAAALYGATYTRVTGWPGFREAVRLGLDGGLHIVEVPTDRDRNVALHRRCWPAVAAALTDMLARA